MNLMSFLYHGQDRLAEYKRLRQKSRDLNSLLTKLLPKSALMDGAKGLGLRKGRLISFGNEDEISVLIDYCLYSFRRGGKTVMEKYLENSPPPEWSDEMILLRAMVRSFYSIFVVKGIERGRGVTLHDVLRDFHFFLMDVGIGSTAARDMLFAGRVLPLPDFCMTSGAFLPLDLDLAKEIVRAIPDRYLAKEDDEGRLILPHRTEAVLSARIIRKALKRGYMETMTYMETECLAP
jgi:hypothetical protein